MFFGHVAAGDACGFPAQSPVHTNEQMDHLVRSLTELWEACPLAKGQIVRLAAE
jgi:hypothetical protein